MQIFRQNYGIAHWTACLALALGWWMAAPRAAAQEDDTGVGLVEGFGGGVFGLGAHGAAGASFAVPTAKHIVPFLEVAYSPLSTYDFRYGSNDLGKGLHRSRLFDFNGGVKVRFPNRTHAVPYVGLGIGLLHFSADTYASGFGSTTTVTQTRNEAAGNLSAGMLYYLTDHFGLQPELKGYTASNIHFFRASVGIFYQFP
jgi:hypothetical protein